MATKFKRWKTSPGSDSSRSPAGAGVYFHAALRPSDLPPVPTSGQINQALPAPVEAWSLHRSTMRVRQSL